jgi:hypothetical protein
MNQHDTNFNPIHDGFIAVLNLIQQYHGRDVAQGLLQRIQNTFDNGGIGKDGGFETQGRQVFQKTPRDIRDDFLRTGGYSLIEHDVMVAKGDQVHRTLAFGIQPASQNQPEARLVFLLINGEEVVLNIRQLVHHSYNRNAAYRGPNQPGQPVIMFMAVDDFGAVATPATVSNLLNNLKEVNIPTLYNAVAKLDPWAQVKDDVPKSELVSLTDYERDNLPAIPNVLFAYNGQPEELIRIVPAGREDYTFYTRHQAVSVSASMVEVSKYLVPGQKETWLLQTTPHASVDGVPLRSVMMLNEYDRRRDEYLSLIDVFTVQMLEHAQRQPKQQ